MVIVVINCYYYYLSSSAAHTLLMQFFHLFLSTITLGMHSTPYSPSTATPLALSVNICSKENGWKAYPNPE